MRTLAAMGFGLILAVLVSLVARQIIVPAFHQAAASIAAPGGAQ